LPAEQVLVGRQQRWFESPHGWQIKPEQ